jgi:hypothetical protein
MLSRSVIKISEYRTPTALANRFIRNLSKLGRHVQAREIVSYAGESGIAIPIDELLQLGFLPQTPQTWKALCARLLDRWEPIAVNLPSEYSHAGEVRELLQTSQNPQDIRRFARLLNGLTVHRKKETGTLLKHLLESEKFPASLPLAG